MTEGTLCTKWPTSGDSGRRRAESIVSVKAQKCLKNDKFNAHLRVGLEEDGLRRKINNRTICTS